MKSINYYLQFIFGTLLLFGMTGWGEGSLITLSGDAHSIWQTIKSFPTDELISSYVLYKGFLSVYPYVWLYEIAVYFSLNEFYFVKIYHAILFGVAAGMAVPFSVARLLNRENNLYLSLLFILTFFILAEYTLIFDSLMIDLPSFSFFSISMALILLWKDLDGSLKRVSLSFIAGIALGLVFSASGQYALSGFILLGIFLYYIKKSAYKIKFRMICIAALLFGLSIPKHADYVFDQNVVSPMRASGEWIPSGGQWFASSLSRMMDSYKYGFPDVNNRGKAIMADHLGEDFDEKYKLIKSSQLIFSGQEYIGLLLAYPFDFVVIWFTKLFLAISFDDGKMSLSHLIVAYTSIFICIKEIAKRFDLNTVTNNPISYFGASILASIVAPVLLHIEMRYSTSLLAYVLCFAIYLLYRNFAMLGFGSILNLRSRNLYQILFGGFLAWSIFIILLVSFFGSIVETSSFNPDKILFKL